MKYYFAYGSNMNKDGMNYRCPDAEFIGIGTLENYTFFINSHGLATVIPQDNSMVYGSFWNISHRDEQRLDYYEGINANLYIKKYVPIITNSQPVENTLIYIATNTQKGNPIDGYLRNIIQWAKRLQLPESYIRELQSWLS